MQRTFSIVTTSKGRLEHLKASLPSMLKQPAEVIVVDFSCPQGTGDYVREHCPAARVVAVEGEDYYSNWKARNAGAAVAASNMLLFCDADTILGENALAWLSDNLPAKAYGTFKQTATSRFNTSRLRLANNQLKGFLAVPSAAFRRLGGYDEVLEGYASGGDTDLADRLNMIGVAPFWLDPGIIEAVVEHDNADRTRHHRDPIAVSYCAGMLYRSAKLAVLRMTKRVQLPIATRRNLYAAARTAAGNLGASSDTVSMSVQVQTGPVGMPRQLGYEKGTHKLSLKVEVSLENKLAAIPE